MKADAVSKYTSTRQTEIVNDFADNTSTTWKSRYKDLFDLDKRLS